MRRFFTLVSICFAPVTSVAQTNVIAPVQHVRFDSPEGWALKYFTSATLLSGLEPAKADIEQRSVGSINIGLELGWLPALSPEQTRVGFAGTQNEDLNKVPIFVRPVLRVGLPFRFTAIAAGPLPFEVFGATPRLFALGLERPIVERERWSIAGRVYGQVGYVRGAFTCPAHVLAFAPGSPQNPTDCVAQSSDSVHMRYAGAEIEFSHRIPKTSKLTGHASAGVNLIDGTFQVNARLQDALDHTRLWTRGATFSATAGASYLLTKRVALTIDAFYSPLWVQRDPSRPSVNDGMFNVRAFLSFAAR